MFVEKFVKAHKPAMYNRFPMLWFEWGGGGGLSKLPIRPSPGPPPFPKPTISKQPIFTKKAQMLYILVVSVKS